jgi:hypothetical protein
MSEEPRFDGYTGDPLNDSARQIRASEQQEEKRRQKPYELASQLPPLVEVVYVERGPLMFDCKFASEDNPAGIQVGLQLTKFRSGVPANLVAQRDGRLGPGDALEEVNGVRVQSMPFDDILSLIRIASYPLHLKFSPSTTGKQRGDALQSAVQASLHASLLPARSKASSSSSFYCSDDEEGEGGVLDGETLDLPRATGHHRRPTASSRASTFYSSWRFDARSLRAMPRTFFASVMDTRKLHEAHFLHFICGVCTVMFAWQMSEAGWEFASLAENPLLGPSAKWLVYSGGQVTGCMIGKGQWWRLISTQVQSINSTVYQSWQLISTQVQSINSTVYQ